MPSLGIEQNIVCWKRGNRGLSGEHIRSPLSQDSQCMYSNPNLRQSSPVLAGK
jgi:hypothetical protein